LVGDPGPGIYKCIPAASIYARDCAGHHSATLVPCRFDARPVASAFDNLTLEKLFPLGAKIQRAQ
jgi:hypothetical protein